MDAALSGERFEPDDRELERVRRSCSSLPCASIRPRSSRTRRRNYELLASLLPREGQLLPELPEGVCPLYLPVPRGGQAGAIRALAREGDRGVPLLGGSPPVDSRGAFPEAEHLRQHVLALPVYQGLSSRDVEYLAKSVLAVTRAQ